MANEWILIVIPFFILFIIIIVRNREIIPQLIFWLFARGKEFDYTNPQDIGITADLVEISTEETIAKALFFPANSDSGILMVTNWFLREDYYISLKTASFFQSAGYNVLLPLYHELNDSGTKFQKKNLAPKKCQRIIQSAFDFLIVHPAINKRRIGIYSNTLGTVLASRLIKNQPIKAVILENGPVDLWSKLAGYLNLQKDIPFVLSKISLIFFLWPFLWRTDWQSSGVINNLHACPTFFIASREDQTFPRKYIWRNFSRLHLKSPHKLWFEHALLPASLSDTWNQEYMLQIRNFYDRWLLGEEQPDFHYDFSVKRKTKGKYPVEIRITIMPPQMEDIPLQIILSDKGSRNATELRIWFNGASMTINYESNMKPTSISLLPYGNVISNDNPERQWVKKGAQEALDSTVEQMAHIPYYDIDKMLDRYFFLKGILLNEQGFQDQALEVFNTSITKEYWKNLVKTDSDTQFFFENRNPRINSSISNGLSLSSTQE
ncbi:MAG: alpha/beta hydrolase family protein [Candidatus Hermodarchaeota archaeon]